MRVVVPPTVKGDITMMYKNNLVAVIKSDGYILRENNNTVYMPFGSEYSIYLKNKNVKRALVEIEVDGKNVLNGSKLLIGANESQEIKGFMKDMSTTNKFKFIEKTDQIRKHRGDKIDDGLVRIVYQFEYLPKPIVTWDFRPHWNYDDVKYCDTTVYKSSNTALLSSFRSDAGITVKGMEVNQNYNYGTVGNLEPEVYVIVLEIKGATTYNKPVKTPVIVKHKTSCSICGTKNKSLNKFCFNCGALIE